MSYNITHWQTKTLDDLRCPIASLYREGHEGWHPDRAETPDGKTKFSILESFVIGVVADGILFVESIKVSGEGSGHVYHDTILPALLASTGTLIAIRVWESGDYVDRMEIVDGVLTETEVEL